MGPRGPQTLGIISDTHGLVRPEAVRALEDCDLLIHAGDVGTPEVLEELRAIAPLVAVRGNVDAGSWAKALAWSEVVDAGQQQLYVLHNLEELDLDPAAAGFRVVISGHSHKPALVERDGVLYLNPGSAGPRRFALPICLARIEVRGRNLFPEFVELVPGGSELPRATRPG